MNSDSIFTFTSIAFYIFTLTLLFVIGFSLYFSNKLFTQFIKVYLKT